MITITIPGVTGALTFTGPMGESEGLVLVATLLREGWSPKVNDMTPSRDTYDRVTLHTDPRCPESGDGITLRHACHA